MINFKLHPSVFLLVIGLTISTQVAARDVANEQYNVTMAQKEYDNAKANDDAIARQVKEQEAHVNEALSQLKELKQKKMTSKAQLEKAKAYLDKQQSALDKAWNKGDK